MIILSFLAFAFMLVWVIGSAFAIALGFCCMDGNADGKALLVFIGGIFSLVIWYQVLVWGEPWFRVLGSAWL